MQAAMLKQADQQELMAQAALYRRAAEATKKVGDSYVYRVARVEELFDKAKIERLVFGADQKESKQLKQLINVARRNQEWQKLRGEEN